jgi:hypothetical protein
VLKEQITHANLDLLQIRRYRSIDIRRNQMASSRWRRDTYLMLKPTRGGGHLVGECSGEARRGGYQNEEDQKRQYQRSRSNR